MTPGTREVRSLRPPKPVHDPWRAQGVLVEDERGVDGCLHPSLIVFLTGAECPFTCVFCDLWRYTLDGPTPPGALPTQLERALADLDDGASPDRAFPARGGVAKLYNASNWFDERAVPAADDERLAELLARFDTVVVESHPRLVGERAWSFAAGLGPRLQVAMGLETVHPEAGPRLGKRSTPDDFARAADTLRRHGVGVRAFVLVGAPWVPRDDDARWVRKSVRFAVEAGAEHVALIPVRGGNGALERLEETGAWTPPSLHDLERALDATLGVSAPESNVRAVVTADLWDLERFSECDACLDVRRARLERMNLSGTPEPPVLCPACAP